MKPDFFIESALLLSGQGSVSQLDLSEQNLVSCVNPKSSPYNGYGCGGGWIDNNVNYVKWLGQVKESAWSYAKLTGTCTKPASATMTSSGTAVKLTGGAVRTSPYRSASAIKAALANGPVGFLMMAASDFMSYRGGIYNSALCTTSINHAMTLVGGWVCLGYETATNVHPPFQPHTPDNAMPAWCHPWSNHSCF